MTLTLPEIELAAAKLEKAWREAGGSVDFTKLNLEEDVVVDFATKYGLGIKHSLSTGVIWCCQNKTGDRFGESFSVMLTSKRKAPAATGA